MNDPIPAKLTYAEFVEFVKVKDEAYEYVDGAAVRTDSPSNEHSRLATVLLLLKGDDVTDKFMEYPSMPSIEEYIIIDSTRHWVRRCRRDSEGKFVADFDHIGGSVRLASIDYTLDIDAMYAMARV
jgi:Uma2 family endonuclease